MIRSATIFCASSNQAAPVFYDAAREVAEVLTVAGIALFYGGGKSGLMGRVADTVIEKKGKITGVQPRFMKEQGWFHEGIDELVLVEDLQERKRILFREAGAIIALAGGCGTAEELLEAITLKQLGQFTWPIIILNTKGFYDPLLLQLERMIEENFMRPEHRQLWKAIPHAGLLLEALRNAPPWDPANISKAQI